MTIYDVIIYHVDYMKYKQLQNLMNIRDNYFLLCDMSIILLYGVFNYNGVDLSVHACMRDWRKK